MFPELSLPAFDRLTDFLGAWAMEPGAFAALWATIGRMDLAEHLRQKPPELESRTELVPGRGGRSIAMIPLTGTLMKGQSSLGGTSTVQTRRDIRNAAADPNVSAILLAVESPGGTVAGTADLASEIKAAGRSKPVWAHIDDLGASAAYWAASQAEQIFANAPTAEIGSIGTVLTVYDQSQAASREGVKAMVFATGPLKGAGVPGTAVTDEQAAYFQGRVNGMQEHFDAAVRSGRKITAKELDAVKTGGVFRASVAKDLKLIDGIQPLGKTLAQLADAAESRAGAAGGARSGGTLPMRVLGGLPTVA